MTFMTERTFQEAIEAIVEANRISHMDAVLAFCDENDLDPDDIKQFVSSNLRDKIRQDAVEEGFFKRTAQLPI